MCPPPPTPANPQDTNQVPKANFVITATYVKIITKIRQIKKQSACIATKFYISPKHFLESSTRFHKQNLSITANKKPSANHTKSKYYS